MGGCDKAMGTSTETLHLSYCMYGLTPYGDTFDHLRGGLTMLVELLMNGMSSTQLVSVLLEGPVGSGKSALAASVVAESGIPFIKVITGETLLGLSDNKSKVDQIIKAFDDAYEWPLSAIILDDIERLLEYVAIGPSFNNAILQVL